MRALFTGLALLFSFCSSAGQLLFDRHDLGGDVQFDYMWLGHTNEQHQLSVKINKRMLYDTFRTFKLYQPAVANQYMKMAMRQRASEADPREANIEISQISDQLSISIRSRQQLHIDKWRQILEDAKQQSYQQYLAENFYVEFTNNLGVTGIKPDHVKFARMSDEFLTPLVAEFKSILGEQASVRDTVSLILSWVQSIPYDTLEQRITSNGSGYAPPSRLIDDNKGDCDSKTVLMAALLKAFYPYVDMVYIFLPEHALMGISIPNMRQDKVFEFDDLEFIYIEPTGPALIELGQADERSLQAVANGEVTYEKVIF
ncbi:hypothetical protein QX776_16965 [Alteromonadaceae bacterium BrNp21-10]|nr:hypothetical protein [Alteromonadaceae bacterium BrNp21-10]